MESWDEDAGRNARGDRGFRSETSGAFVVGFAKPGTIGWGWLGKDWGEESGNLAMSCLTCLRDPKGDVKWLAGYAESRFKETVKAAGTNLEVISLRIFKSMGAGEVTQGKDGEIGKKPWSSPREP